MKNAPNYSGAADKRTSSTNSELNNLDFTQLYSKYHQPNSPECWSFPNERIYLSLVLDLDNSITYYDYIGVYKNNVVGLWTSYVEFSVIELEFTQILEFCFFGKLM